MFNRFSWRTPRFKTLNNTEVRGVPHHPWGPSRRPEHQLDEVRLFPLHRKRSYYSRTTAMQADNSSSPSNDPERKWAAKHRTLCLMSSCYRLVLVSAAKCSILCTWALVNEIPVAAELGDNWLCLGFWFSGSGCRGHNGPGPGPWWPLDTWPPEEETAGGHEAYSGPNNNDFCCFITVIQSSLT